MLLHLFEWSALKFHFTYLSVRLFPFNKRFSEAAKEARARYDAVITYEIWKK